MELGSPQTQRIQPGSPPPPLSANHQCQFYTNIFKYRLRSSIPRAPTNQNPEPKSGQTIHTKKLQRSPHPSQTPTTVKIGASYPHQSKQKKTSMDGSNQPSRPFNAQAKIGRPQNNSARMVHPNSNPDFSVRKPSEPETTNYPSVETETRTQTEQMLKIEWLRIKHDHLSHFDHTCCAAK